MHAIHALHAAFHPDEVLPIGDETCAICGDASTRDFSSATVMADTFVRYDVFRRPDSPYVCTACAWYLDALGKRTGGDVHPQFSRMSYIVSAEGWWREITREEVRPLLADYPDGPPAPLWLVLSRIKKKHLILEAQPWMPGRQFVALFEEGGLVRVPRSSFEQLGATIDELLIRGIGKTAIAAGILPQAALRGRSDVPTLRVSMRSLDPWRPSATLSLALWIARTPEKEEIANGEYALGTLTGVPAGSRPAQPGLPRSRRRVQITPSHEALGAG
jgi:hypothetical protein